MPREPQDRGFVFVAERKMVIEKMYLTLSESNHPLCPTTFFSCWIKNKPWLTSISAPLRMPDAFFLGRTMPKKKTPQIMITEIYWEGYHTLSVLMFRPGSSRRAE
jgi:hypothetical protein